MKKGRALADKQSPTSIPQNDTGSEDNTAPDPHLLQLAEDFLISILDYNTEKTEQLKNALTEYLKSEYENMKTRYRKDVKAKQVMMMKIRCSLVKHPYDHVGRRMAKETKTVFKRNVLGETRWWHKMEKCFKIPACLLKIEWVQKALILAPIIIATMTTAHKGAVYCYDIYSDVQVIRELKTNIVNFTLPEFNQIDNLFDKISDFLLEKVQNEGKLIKGESCELLDLIENVLETLPFYKLVISNIAQVHWNPNRNSDSDFDLSDVFRIVREGSRIIREVLQTTNAAKISEKPSNWPNELRKLRINLQSGLASINLGTSGIGGWLDSIGVINTTSIKRYKPIVEKSIKVLWDIDRNVLTTPIVTQILKATDGLLLEEREEEDLVDFINALSTELIEKFNKTAMSKFTSTWPSHHHKGLNQSHLECRKYLKRLFQLGDNKKVKKYLVSYFSKPESDGNIDRVADASKEKLKFMTVHIIRSAYFFLILTMTWSILLEAKGVLIDFWKSWHIPLVTNFQLTCQENDSSSSLWKQGQNSSNDYVVKSAQRNSVNIMEATNETLSAVNVQIAVWVYMASLLRSNNSYMKESFNWDISNALYGLNDGAFTDFSTSAVCSSLVAGIISLTFAQYKQYMTRHEKDAPTEGKIVYFLACAANSLAVFLNQTNFFAVGIVFTVNVLIIIIRYIVIFDTYGNMPPSEEVMVVILVFLVVLTPLKLIPSLFARLIKRFTDDWILHETEHMNLRNRSGYDVPGIKIAQFMFLPSAHNSHRHITDKGSTHSPGFFYFSKDPLSKKLYRLRFELHLYHMVTMHLFYLIFTFVLINLLDIVFYESTIGYEGSWLSQLRLREARLLGRSLLCNVLLCPSLGPAASGQS